jgi:hypothetical protein
MVGRRAAFAFLLGLAAALATSCGGDAPTIDLGGGCTLASDCKSPLICAYQRCHSQCASDRDCPSSERCVRTPDDGNVCQLPVENDCERTSDCPAGEVCAVDQQCRNSCRDAKDCTPGEVCVSGTCASSKEVGPDGKLPLKSGDDGTPCRYDSECQAPRFCRNNECVFPCVADADCPLEARCFDHQCEAVEPVCVPGQQRLCEPCGIKICDDAGMWGACSHDGCGGSGQGGMGGASSSQSSASGSGASTSHSASASSTHASTGAAGGSSTSVTTGSGATGAAGSSSVSGTTAASSTTGAAGSSATGSCMPCASQIPGADLGQGGVLYPRNNCCMTP